MKILKEGRKDRDLWIGQCRRCGAVVQKRKDELTNLLQDYDGNDHSSYEICPFCKQSYSIYFYHEGTKAVDMLFVQSVFDCMMELTREQLKT